MKRWTTFAAALCLGIVFVSPSLGQTKEDFEKGFQKYGTPGKEHKYLQPLAGRWNVEGKFYMNPGEEPTTSKATSTRKWVFGKRYLVEEYKGEVFGKPFSGMGMTGYDRAKKKFVGSWVDSMSTAIMPNEGTYDSSTKTFTYRGVLFDPYSGKKWKSKDVLTVKGKNQHTFKMYRQDLSGGPEFLMMELNYLRAERKKRNKKNN
ncbi:MAG: DUF1579 domain-containing protein [Gemmataceae bacterium]